MHDNDSFRVMDPDLAVGLFCAAIATAALLGGFPEPKVTKPTTPIHCEVTVAQYGPGERWRTYPLPPSSVCAGAVVVAPNHILTNPLPEAK